MAAWIPVLKTVLPYLTTLVTATVPVFQARKDDEKIAELQDATKHNAESIKLLAEQMQRAIQAIETGAAAADRLHRRALALSFAALLIAVLSLLTVFVFIWSH